MNQLPKFRGFRSTGIQQPTTSTSGGHGGTAKVQDLTPPEPKKPKSNLFSNIVKGVVQPAVDYTKFVGEAALQGGRALINPTMRKAVFNPGAMTEEDHLKMAEMKPTFLVDEKDIDGRKNIAKTGLKRTAGAATYAIPGSVGVKGLGGVALSGATTGGLYGLYEGDDINPERIFSNAATGAALAPAMVLGGRAVNKATGAVANKFSGVNKKLGQKLLDEADDYAVKSTRINTSRQNKFQKATGKTIGEFVEQNNLYGQDLDAVQALIDPLQKARSKAIRDGNKMINPTQVVDDFNAQIAELTTGANSLDPSNLKRAKSLTIDRDNFVNEAVRYAQQTGDDSLSQYPLAFLEDAKVSIDKNTPKPQFLSNPQEAGNMRATGDIYRKATYREVPEARGQGLKLRDLYSFRDALESAPKGKNTLPFGLNKGVYGTMGGVATKLPFGVGSAIGMAGESIINNPKNIGRMSQGMRSVGNAMVNSQMPRVPGMAVVSAATRLPSNVARNATLNTVNAGMNSGNVQQVPYEQFLQEQGAQDSEIAQFAYQNDLTIEEVVQLLREREAQQQQTPKFRGFSR